MGLTNVYKPPLQFRDLCVFVVFRCCVFPYFPFPILLVLVDTYDLACACFGLHTAPTGSGRVEEDLRMAGTRDMARLANPHPPHPSLTLPRRLHPVTTSRQQASCEPGSQCTANPLRPATTASSPYTHFQIQPPLGHPYMLGMHSCIVLPSSGLGSTRRMLAISPSILSLIPSSPLGGKP